jgi:hypothetical protein
MKQTSKYKLGYFEENDITSSITEMQRWETLDAQLYALYSILGNGILNGWNLLASSGLSVVVTSGAGNVTFVAVKSTDNATITGLTPDTRNYIYAILNTDSYWNQTVSFVSFLSRAADSYALYLGYIDTDSTSVTDVNTDGRTNLGFINLIRQFIKDHRHIGGSDNPEPIDLGSEVQGTINQRNLPDLDASIITSGTLDVNRLPIIDHITKLINQGTLTHAQLDSFIEALAITNPTLMGETSTIDLLQLILALKHIYPGIDDYLVNEIAYIPGISPDSYVDVENTTATVDYRTSIEGGTHTITGESAPGKNAYTKTWDSESEFTSDVYSNVFIDGDTVTLATEEDTLTIDDFIDVNDWQVITTDLSSVSGTFTLDGTTFVVPTKSGKLLIGDSLVEMTLSLKKEFDVQDWSGYNYIVFYLKTTSVNHGDIYFYFNDSFSGTQNSYIKVLDRNTPTINVDTLQNGWQEITVDISKYDRTSVNTIGFYVSTQDGWDTSKGFDFNLDNIYLTSGNKFKENGYIRLIFGSEFLYDFWRVRWDAIIPTDSNSLGLELKWRTRVGNSILDLSTAIWSSYTSISGNPISLPSSALYKYIEIEVYFGASTDLTRTAYLRKVFLDFYASDVDNSFTYETKDDWDSGDKFNIDTSSVLNSMLISKTNEVNDIFYGTQGNAVQLDDNLNELYRVSGLMLPRSTYQMLNDIPPSLGLITGISRGNDGNMWLADVDNDRVIEVDKSGGLVRGFYGSYLVENNVVSTVITSDVTSNATTPTTTTTTTTVAVANMNDVFILQALYNFNKGFLYIIFNRDLTDDEVALITNQYLRVGTNIFYLDGLTVAKALNGFDHVLKISIDSANKVLLNHLLYTGAPSVVIASPYEKQRLSSSQVVVQFLLYNFTLGTTSGENAIRVTLDNTTVQDIYLSEVTFTGLSAGTHTIKAQLLTNGVANTNIESVAESTFVIYNGTYSLPYLSITSPRPNQISSSYPVQVSFNVENFPILPTEQHLRYVIDTDAPIDYYSTDPILINYLDRGKHTIRLYLVDKAGNDLGYNDVTVEFIVGLNSNATVKYYCSINGNIANIYTDVANLIFTDVYSPFDVQYIMPGNDVSNPDDKESILIGKLSNDYVMAKLGRL